VSGEKPAPEKTNVSAYFHAQQQAPQRLASLQNDPQKHANSTTRSINSNKSQQTTNSKHKHKCITSNHAIFPNPIIPLKVTHQNNEIHRKWFTSKVVHLALVVLALLVHACGGGGHHYIHQ
jgi:hypothetical protein